MALLSTADQVAIQAVIVKADAAATARDVDGYVALFTEDAVLDGDQGLHSGRTALRAAVGPIWQSEGATTLHLTANPVIGAIGEDGSHAEVRSILLIVDVFPELRLRGASSIRQELCRRGMEWLISRREVSGFGPKPAFAGQQ